jgi:3-phosphoshikimate 1-carboxyvinyltransferase
MELRVPGDKSITHRALILAALGEGTSRLRGALAAGDTRATASVLRALGVRLGSLAADEILVPGLGRRGLHAPAAVLDCHNSGTTARLLLGVLAAQPLEATLTGDDSLRSRPMRRVTEPLTRMGARIEELAAPDRLPLRVRGGELRPLVHATPQPSAQVKSALLLAGLCAGAAVAVREPACSRDHTERMLRSLGVALSEEDLPDGHQTTLDGSAPAWTLDLDVPGDFSSAAFLLAVCVLLRRHDVLVRDVGVNPTRTGLLDVLARMGAAIEPSGGATLACEPRADLRVAAAELQATEVTPAEVPRLIDELPLLAVLGARADGETVIRGAGELRVKESDRIGALVENLRALGGTAEELPDGLVVRGSDAPLRGHVRSRGDHRIAMAFAVLGVVPGNEITIDDPRLAEVSFPGFFDLLRRISEPA